LWFVIGGSHVSGRLPRPHHQRREEMALQEGGEVIMAKKKIMMCMDKSFILAM